MEICLLFFVKLGHCGDTNASIGPWHSVVPVIEIDDIDFTKMAKLINV